jgi:outer membrane lipoprotein LolB
VGTPISWNQRASTLKNIQSFTLSGKIAIETNQNAGSAFVFWQQEHQQFTMTLSGPLGMSEIKLNGQPGNVTLLAANGKQYQASSPEQLLQQQWGWNLPISHLNFWIRGLPAPNMQKTLSLDSSQHIRQLNQAHFDIQYLEYQTINNGIDLPRKIFINSPWIKIKIIIYDWKLG